MARHRVAPQDLPAEAGFVVDTATAEAAKQLEEWTNRKTKKSPRAKGFSEGQLRRASEELEKMFTSGEWEDAEAKHFLALYVLLHGKVYGVAPIMTSFDRLRAMQQAGSFMRNRFDGDPTELALFMRWAWQREAGKEKWCQSQNIQKKSRIGWRLIFSASEILNDYLVERARAEKMKSMNGGTR